MQRLKHKKLSRIISTSLILIFSLISLSVVSAYAEDIPIGCPGSNQQGPGAYDCSKIPLGCPGSTLQGPIASQPKSCPFTAPEQATSGPKAPTPDGLPTPEPAVVTKYHCGSNPQIATAIDIGCRGENNPIIDMLFAVLRILSNGVGLVIVGSIIVGGIQYTTSAGDPQASAKAIGRIRATVIALGLYIFAYPLLNYLLPLGFFK